MIDLSVVEYCEKLCIYSFFFVEHVLHINLDEGRTQKLELKWTNFKTRPF